MNCCVEEHASFSPFDLSNIYLIKHPEMYKRKEGETKVGKKNRSCKALSQYFVPFCSIYWTSQPLCSDLSPGLAETMCRTGVTR